MYLFFDCETTGLPPRARMAQLAFVLCDEQGNIITEYASRVKPNGWVIPKEKFFIENNMSTERCEAEGKPVFEVLREFQEALKQCSYKIAHNIAFDKQIVQNELILAGIEYRLFQFKKEACTMLSSMNYVGARNKNGGIKWPKLDEMYKKCFNKELENAHDALADVRATAECFFELKKRGIIKI